MLFERCSQGKRWSRRDYLDWHDICSGGLVAAGPVPMLNRRHFLTCTAGLSASAVLARAGNAEGAGLDGITTASMRGSIDATEMGV